jgi:two-component system response regulator
MKAARPIILLVEDSEDDVELTVRALKKSRLVNEVVVTRSGEEALGYLGIHDGAPKDGLPQLVLLDVNLPRMNGHEVVKAIRANPATRHIPVVMLTSSALEEDIVRSYEEGANSYVRKPLKLPEFVEAVQQLQMYWLLLNELPAELT